MEEKKILVRNKKQMFIIIGAFILTLLLGTVTYAFFNYTRTGSNNTIRTGRIAFDATQNGSINLTDAFPIDSQEAQSDTTNAKTVTITVTGDTDYSEGLEYLVTLANVSLAVGGKELPIALEVTATNLGTLEEGDYYTAHENYTTTNKYKILYDGTLEEDARVLAGYIAPNTVLGTSNNTSGTINIKAYIDKSRILISDTYPAGTKREVITGYSTSACETALTGLENASTICASTSTLQGALDGNTLTSAQITALLNAGVIREYTDETTNPDNKTVFTTEEWNGIQGSPLSFRVKVESNEGKWIESEVTVPTIASCPGCKFMYSTNTYNYGTNGTYLSSVAETISGDYNDVITSSRKHFLGFTTTGTGANERIDHAYACGVYGGTVSGDTVFCIEGSTNGLTYEANNTLLNEIYGPYDSDTSSGCYDYSSSTWCNGADNTYYAIAYNRGDVVSATGDYEEANCTVSYDGSMNCY